ncbi:MAG: PLDc N-terminal domain-containing protein [Halarcobacter sp.]
MNIQVNGIVGFIILFFDIIAIIKIAKSGASTVNKAIWILIVLFLPLIGLIAWYFLGPKG